MPKALVGNRYSEKMRIVRVSHFLRRPVAGWFSIERLFADVRTYLPSDIRVEVVVSPYVNEGVLNRLRNAIAARRRSDEVNHVLGDVHYLAWFLPRRKTILTVLDCIPLENKRGLRRIALWLLWYWLPLQNARYVSVISDYTRRSLLKWVDYPPADVVVIPPAVSPDFTYVAPRSHETWSRLLQIGATPNKNVLRLIEAVAGLDITLVMVGRLSDQVLEKLEQHKVAYENHSAVDDAELVDLYRDCDMLVFPSTYEGWGMPIIEAHATGRPVVTSDFASMPEAAGGAACLVNPFDVESIRAGVQKVLSDEQYAMSLINSGLENAKNYEAGKIAVRYADLYRKIAASAEMSE